MKNQTLRTPESTNDAKRVSINESLRILLELSLSDRRVLQGLKSIAVKHQQYELAASLRTIETEQFPEAKTNSKEYAEARKFKAALNLTDLNCSHKLSYTILSVAKAFQKMKDDYDLRTASKIIAEANNIFGDVD